ncbi:uncharacterized protein [Diadema setosum]|uniref:uncharacterized protein n=1 Tax=Diadema setosum TaxID=31175 RepID=UPI003B3B6E4E
MVALLLAFCLVANASHVAKAVKRNVGAPQEQNMFDMPFAQTGPSLDGSIMDMDSSSSSESEEIGSVVDMDMDMDMDTDGNAAAGGAAAAGVNPAGNQLAGNTFGRVGNAPSTFGRNAANKQDQGQNKLGRKSSSGQGVGIAFAVIGLVGVAVAATLYAVKKYRQRIPVVQV